MTRMRAMLAADDRGFTLIEMLVAFVLFGVLGTILLSTAINSRDAVRSSQESHDLNEEARVALNRMARELRQARELTAVSAPDGSTSLTFWVDFNGNDAQDTTGSDPEVLTYSFADSRIVLSATDAAGNVITSPILAGQVSDFRLDYFSSDYRRDCNGDGVTNWLELDAYTTTCTAKPGADGALDASELAEVDAVQIEFSVLEGTRRQDYKTQVDLRNAS